MIGLGARTVRGGDGTRSSFSKSLVDVPVGRSLCRQGLSSGAGTRPLRGRTSLSIRGDPLREYWPKAYTQDGDDEHDDLRIHRGDDELEDGHRVDGERGRETPRDPGLDAIPVETGGIQLSLPVGVTQLKEDLRRDDSPPWALGL